MDNKKLKRNAGLFAALALISLGNSLRKNYPDTMRPVDFISIFASGMLFGIFAMSIMILVKAKREGK